MTALVVYMPTIQEVLAADLTAAISELPVIVRYGGEEIPASFNGGRLTLEAVDGGMIDDNNATIVALASLFPSPLPTSGKVIEVRNADGATWRRYKCIAVTERNDPNAVALNIIIGPPNRA